MSQPDNQQPPRDLGSELRELGQQLEQAFKTALESDRARQLQADLSAGMREIGSQLQNALKAIQDNPRVQTLVERGEQTVAQAQQSKAAQDVQETLAKGLSVLNDQLATLVTRLRQDDGSTTGSAADGSTSSSSTGFDSATTGYDSTTGGSSFGSADAGTSSPAIGETTRLDPDQKP